MRPALPVLALALGILVWITVSRSRLWVTERDVDWLAGSMGAQPDEADVYRRYLHRHRAHRLAGGLLGGALAAVVGVRWYGTVRVGIGEVSPLADVLFGSVAGIVVGALVAESFRIDRRRPRVAAASLEVRPRLAATPEVVGARILTVAALAVGVSALIGAEDAAALATGGLGTMIVLGAEATRATVVGRGRPVLSPRADRVDRRLRGVAVVLVGRLEVAAAVLTSGWVLSVVPVRDPVGQVLQVLGVVAALVVTLVWLHRAAPRAPRHWSPSEVYAAGSR